ncbi:MAG: ComF family protein [Acidobacteriota bacterium]
MTVTDPPIGPRALWNDWVHFVLPCPCLGCGRPLAAPAPRLMLCRPCRGRLSPRRGPSCRRCARPLADPELATCTACIVRTPELDRLWIPWRYLPPLDSVVQALKFRRLEHLGGDLALGALEEIGPRRLAERLKGRTGPPIEWVVPIPLHWRRRLQRGYNQAEAIARPLAERLELPLIRALRRPRATPPQTGLGRRERLRNPRRSFRLSATYQQKLSGEGVLLVDDVLTTGATLRAAAQCLRQGGVRRVEGFVIARSPEEQATAGSELTGGPPGPILQSL